MRRRFGLKGSPNSFQSIDAHSTMVPKLERRESISAEMASVNIANSSLTQPVLRNQEEPKDESKNVVEPEVNKKLLPNHNYHFEDASFLAKFQLFVVVTFVIQVVYAAVTQLLVKQPPKISTLFSSPYAHMVIVTVLSAGQSLMSQLLARYILSTVSRARGVKVVLVLLQLSSMLQQCSNIHGYIKPMWWRLLVTYPQAIHLTVSTLFTLFIWPIYNLLWHTSPAYLRFVPHLFVRVAIWVPIVLAIVGVHNSLVSLPTGSTLPNHNKLSIDDTTVDASQYHVYTLHLEGHDENAKHELRIVQLSDIHLGPMMSVEQLYQISEEVAQLGEHVDLVLLTGDFYTMESHHEHSALSQGLAPLAQLTGKVFACIGNHDKEIDQEIVEEELARVGAKLLVDDSQLVQVPRTNETVQLVGFDFILGSRAKEHTVRVFQLAEKQLELHHTSQLPIVRIAMLHNPNYFTYLPFSNRAKQVVFSGHLHGGQLALRRFGIDWSVLSVFSFFDAYWYCSNPVESSTTQEMGPLSSVFRFTEDNVHEMCAAHANYLYVHSGTGYYGFPLRIGTSSERNTFIQIYS